MLVFACVLMWAIRLSIYLGLRHLDGEDFRYANMRKRWNEKFGNFPGYYIVAFLYIFMMQYGFSMLANWAGIYVMIYGNENATSLTVLDWVGAGIWAFGLIFEMVGDQQL